MYTIYQIIVIYNINTILVQDSCVKYLKKVLDVVRRNCKVQSISSKMCRKTDLLNELKPRYDLVLFEKSDVRDFLHVMHRGVWLFAYGKRTDTVQLPYTNVGDCFEGLLFRNDLHSIVYDAPSLNVFEQTFVRDKPYRFLKKAVELCRATECKTIVEIGSCRRELTHDLDDVNPLCCNDGHSTFFWCLTDATVHTIDINPACRRVFAEADRDGRLTIEGELKSVIGDGIKFLRQYDGPSIDFLFLDAWDDCEKYLEAYETARSKLASSCAIAVDGTDLDKGKRTSVLVPKLLGQGWTILWYGRQTLMVSKELAAKLLGLDHTETPFLSSSGSSSSSA